MNRTRPILCATDFSESSVAALRLAAALSRKTGAPLTLLHVLEGIPIEPAVLGDAGPFRTTLVTRAAEMQDAYRRASGEKLLRDARAASPENVQTIVRDDARPADAISAVAAELDARLVVVGTHGRRAPSRWILGSVAERTVRSAPCPVLVVPPSDNVRFPDTDHPLRIAVALDTGDDTPMTFVRGLRQAVPCDVTVIHLYWPPAEVARQSAPRPIPLGEPEPEVVASLERELRENIGSLPGTGDLSFVVRPEWGRLSEPLAREARAAKADLLVLGAQGRYSLAPLAGRAGTVLRRLEVPVVFVPREPGVEAHPDEARS